MTQQYKPFSSEDGQDIIEWYEEHQGQPTQKEVSKLIGEIAGEKVREDLGRESLLSTVDKTVAQGTDAIDYEPETGDTVTAEDKGIKSTESSLQKDEMHSVRQNEIALYGEKYHANRISMIEIGAGQEVIQAHESGQLRYEVYHTTIDQGDNKIKELVTNVTKEIRPNGELSPNFIDRSSPSELTYESPEDTLIRRETAIAQANQALESGNLSPKKEQEVRELLVEVTSPQQEIQGGLIPFEKAENQASSSENLPSEPQEESQNIPLEVSDSEITSTISNSSSNIPEGCQETTGSESELSSTLY